MADAQPPTLARWSDDLTERERKEIVLARYYVEHLGAYGTDGHARLVLINKMAGMLNNAPVALMDAMEGVQDDGAA